MDTEGIASMVTQLLTAVASKSAEDSVKALGEFAYGKAKDLYNFLNTRWSGDPEAKTTLQLFEGNPKRHLSALTDILVTELQTDAEFSEQLAGSLSGIEPSVEVRQKIGLLLGEATATEIENLVRASVRTVQEALVVAEGAKMVGPVIKNA